VSSEIDLHRSIGKTERCGRRFSVSLLWPTLPLRPFSLPCKWHGDVSLGAVEQ
jgi:hypothetical protein